MKKIFLIFTIIIFTKTSFAAENIFVLNQQTLLEEAQKNTPTIERIKTQILSSQINKSKINEKFQPKFETKLSRYQSNQDAFIEFAPNVSPISNFSAGISKDFSSGFNLGVYNILERQTYDGFGTDAKNAFAVKLSVDLYKDIFGRLSKAEISNAKINEDIAKIQAKIDQNIFLINLQKIYWSLSLNEEAILISEELLKKAQIQEVETRKKLRAGIADESDLARQSAQVASKQFDIAILQNNKELLIRNIKELLPTIAQNDVKIEMMDSEEQAKWIEEKIAKIKTSQGNAKDQTSYNEILELLNKSYQQQRKITKRYDDPDLQLYSQYKKYGRDNSSAESFKNSSSSSQESYEVGIELVVPIGSDKIKTRKTQEQLEMAQNLAQTKEILAKITSYQTQTLRNIEILQNALEFQKSDANNLKKVVEVSAKKYDQARISLDDLIFDQNLYLQKRLSAIDVRLTIVNQIFDYLTVFDKI